MAIKWLDRNNRQKRSLSQERGLAKRLSGRRQAGSGSIWGGKGDVRTALRLIECKRTDAKQITLKQAWLDKIRREAIKDGRIPALAIEIGNRRYIVIEEIYL